LLDEMAGGLPPGRVAISAITGLVKLAAIRAPLPVASNSRLRIVTPHHASTFD
jgi:hypothetical protein